MSLSASFFGALSALLKNQYFTISLRFQETFYRKETKVQSSGDDEQVNDKENKAIPQKEVSNNQGDEHE